MVFNQKYGKLGPKIVTGLNGYLKMGLPRAEFECRFWDHKLVVFFCVGLDYEPEFLARVYTLRSPNRCKCLLGTLLHMMVSMH